MSELETEEGRRGNGQVCAVEALKRREVTVTELTDALRRCEVFEAMFAEIAEIPVDERRG